MWSSFFDKIFVVSLLHKNTDRLLNSLRQLEKYEIEAEVFEATFNECGVIGLRDTMIRLFHRCLESGYANVLVFEDDLKVVDDINYYMPLCLDQLPISYDLLYLGAYVIRPFKQRFSENLLLLDKVHTTHAVAYPIKTISKLLPIFEKLSENPNDKTPIDLTILNRVISEGRSYITYPLLVSQQQGYSFIEGKEVDYKKYIELEYKEQAEKLDITQWYDPKEQEMLDEFEKRKHGEWKEHMQSRKLL